MKKFTPLSLILISCVLSLSTVFAGEQQIESGNIINITVLGSPELSRSVLVRQDGSTDYPLLAGIPVDGLTVRQLQEVLRPILARFVERPRLFVNIAEYIQLEITIEGQVNKPGTFTVKGPISLQGVLSIAGGTTHLADLKGITISRQGYDSQNEISINLYEFFLNEDHSISPEMKNGDIVFVPMLTSACYVRVMGAVRSPGSYLPSSEQDIADMINIAGGTLTGGNMDRIIYITSQKGKPTSEIIKLKSLLNSGLTDQIPYAHPGDIIIVGEYRWWQKRSEWMRALRDATLLISSIVILSRI